VRGEFVKRPTSVTISAVLLLLGSLVLTFFAALMVFAGVMIPKTSHAGTTAAAMPEPGFLTAVIVVEALFVLAMAVWGFITFAGLLRMRQWARISMLVIGGGQALICGLSALVMLLFVFLPLPTLAGAAQAPQAVFAAKAILGVMALLFFLHAALGVWWVVYFVRKKTAQAFAAGSTPVENRRPLLISIPAILKLIGAASCLLAATLPLPVIFFSSILGGWRKVVFYLSFAALEAVIGFGLWRLHEFSRKLAMVFTGWGLLYTAYYLAFPSALERFHQAYAKYFGALGSFAATPPEMLEFHSTAMSFSFGLSVLWCVVIVWVLIHYHAAFHPTSEEGPP
jgi:hypothetical protein